MLVASFYTNLFPTNVYLFTVETCKRYMVSVAITTIKISSTKNKVYDM